MISREKTHLRESGDALAKCCNFTKTSWDTSFQWWQCSLLRSRS